MPGTPPQLLVLYDADCGVCRVCVAALLAWDGRRRLRPVAIQSDEGQAELFSIPVGERLLSAHVVDDVGRLHSGGAAAAVVARELPAGAPLARLFEALPGSTDRGYRWVAEHRRTIGRWIPSSWKRGAAKRIAARDRDDPRQT